MDKVNVGLIGLGTVGSGVAKMLLSRRQFLARKAGVPLSLRRVSVRHSRRARVGVDPRLITGSPREILQDPEIQVVVELMGGIHPHTGPAGMAHGDLPQRERDPGPAGKELPPREQHLCHPRSHGAQSD